MNVKCEVFIVYFENKYKNVERFSNLHKYIFKRDKRKVLSYGIISP